MKWLDPEVARRFAAEGTDAYRIANGPLSRVERFGGGVIVSHAGGTLPPRVIQDLDNWCAQAGVAEVAVCSRYLVTGPGREDAPTPVRGNLHCGTARENGLLYEVDLLAGYSCGLFPDQRANRVWLREVRPSRVLNTFAYTCAFSVAAASVGASTLSVDLAKTALERGRRNFALNGLTTDGHRFLSDDVLDVLPRLARRGETFDAILIDPPTFSRGRSGRVFRVEKELPRLLDLAVACAAPGAWILLSTNCLTISAADLRAMAAPFASEFHLPPALPDIPPRDSATTLWLRWGG